MINGQKLFHHIEDEKLVLRNSEKIVVGTSQITQRAAMNRFEFYSLLFGFAWFLIANSATDTNHVLPATA